MASILITGANRGLGLEWARQYATLRWRVYATCRHPSEAFELHALAQEFSRLTAHRLDVTRRDEIQALASELRGESIDILVNNAGVYFEATENAPFGALRYDDWLYTFAVNSLGAVRVTESFVDNVARSDKRLVVGVTSHMGSIEDIEIPGSYYYRSSKAALNAMMKGLSLELMPRRIGVLLIHPGAVRTRMGDVNSPLSTADSVRAMRNVVDQFTLADSGRFMRYNGEEIPW